MTKNANGSCSAETRWKVGRSTRMPERICGSRYSPIAVQRRPAAGRRLDPEAVADRDAVRLGELLLDERRVAAQPRRSARPCRRRATRAGRRRCRMRASTPLISSVIWLTGLPLTWMRSRYWPTAAYDARHAANGVLRVRRQRLEALGGDHDVGADQLVEAAGDRGLEARGEDRDEHDEPEADHQRRRGGRRAARGCASRSRARAGRARRTRRAIGRPIAPAIGSHDGAGDERHADEQQHRAAGQRAEAGWPRGRSRTAPAAGPASPSRLTAAATYGARRRRARRASRSARRRAARPPAGRASRAAPGRAAAASVTPMPTNSPISIVRVASTSPPEGMSSAASKSAPRAAATPSPASRPSTEAATPMASASTATAVEDLPARRAQRAQQRELAGALGDGDREGVEDDEGAHQQRRSREREQRRREEAADRVVGGVGRLGGVGGAGPHGQRARQRLPHRGGQLRGRDAGRGGDRDARQLAGALEPALDVGERRHDERRAAERHAVPPPGDAGDHDPLDAGARAEADVLAHAQPLVARHLAVDDDVTGPPGRAAGEVVEGVERLLARRGDDRRGEAGRDRLAADDERSALGQLALGAADAGNGARRARAAPRRCSACPGRGRS